MTTDIELHAETMRTFSQLRIQKLVHFGNINHLACVPKVDPSADAYLILQPYIPGIQLPNCYITCFYIPDFVDQITLSDFIDYNMGIDVSINDERLPIEIILEQCKSLPVQNGCVYDGYKCVVLGTPFINCNRMLIYRDVDYIFYFERLIFNKCIENNFIQNAVIYTPLTDEYYHNAKIYGLWRLFKTIIKNKVQGCVREELYTECANLYHELRSWYGTCKLAEVTHDSII